MDTDSHGLIMTPKEGPKKEEGTFPPLEIGFERRILKFGRCKSRLVPLY